MWAKPRNNVTNLRQVRITAARIQAYQANTRVFQNWFPGVHQNIGGGYPDQGESNITLAWMMAQVESFLDFDEDYILDQYDQTERYYKQSGQKKRPWSFGKIYRSMAGVYVLGGRSTHTPGLYCQINPETGESTGKPLRDTHEYVHPSARSRIVLRGPGIEDEGKYDCEALGSYKLKFTDETADKRSTAFWELRSRHKGLGPKKELPESPLWTFEKELLRESPRMYNFIYGKSQDL